MQFHCWVFTVTENKSLELRQGGGPDRQFLAVVKKILTLVNEKYIMFSHHPHPILILKKSRTLTVTWKISATISRQIPQCRPNRFSIYEGESNENLKSVIKIQNTARLSCKLTTMILMV